MMRAWGGGYRASMNPVTKLVEFGLEGYIGARGSKMDAGTRALLQVPYLSAGAGPDYNIRTGRVDVVFTVHTPVRRGGFLTRGTLPPPGWWPAPGPNVFFGLSAPRPRPTPRVPPAAHGTAAPAPAPHARSAPASRGGGRSPE